MELKHNHDTRINVHNSKTGEEKSQSLSKTITKKYYVKIFTNKQNFHSCTQSPIKPTLSKASI